jgi:hypothetical protein
MRCASRTQVNTGLTDARPSAPGLVLGVSMPRDALDTALNRLAEAHQRSNRGIADVDAANLRFLEEGSMKDGWALPDAALSGGPGRRHQSHDIT